MISWFIKEKKFIEDDNGNITSPIGFLSSGTKAGLKKKDYDLALIISEEMADVAGVFTSNSIKAAPVIISQKHINNKIKGIIVNSKYANSFTGKKGEEDAIKILKELAKNFNISYEHFLIASTGIIGERLPVQKIISSVPSLIKNLKEEDEYAKYAIMTTDTVPKTLSVSFKIGSKTITIGGMAKGAGMIAPNLATMLAFLTTDINISKHLLKKALKEAVDNSFNKIIIDGDTSTNDSVFIMANGLANNLQITEENKNYLLFKNALTYLCQQLAYKIASDGEGVTKLIELNVKGAKTKQDASKVVRTIASSLLVKTAFFGEDLNWGRIINAIGYSGASIKPDAIDIKCNGLLILRKSSVLKENMKRAEKLLKYNFISFDINLNNGDFSDNILTTDISIDYVKINSDYRS